MLTRLRLGLRLVEAVGGAVAVHRPGTRAGTSRCVLLAAAAVLAFTLAATPIGNDWWHDLQAPPAGGLGG